MMRSPALWFTRSTLGRLALLGVTLLALQVTDARAMCPATTYTGVLHTPTDAALPPELPLLVVIRANAGEGAWANTLDGRIVPIALRVSPVGPNQEPAQEQALEGRLVGPGLIAYHAEPPLAPGEYTLLGLGEPQTLRVADVTLPPLSPPEVRSVVHEERERESRGRFGGGRAWTDRIELGAPLPAHAVALVFDAYGSRAQFDLTPPMHGQTSLLFHGDSGGHCGSERPPDESRLSGPLSVPGLVDQWGRLATADAPVTITQVGALATSRSSGGSSSASPAGSRSSRCAAQPVGETDETSAPWGLAFVLTSALLVRARRRMR